MYCLFAQLLLPGILCGSVTLQSSAKDTGQQVVELKNGSETEMLYIQ